MNKMYVCVKGHYADRGNDRADELCWWAKEAGPYMRIAEDVRGDCAGVHGARSLGCYP